jgi:hypothetical protein
VKVRADPHAQADMLAGPKPTVINAKVAADPLGEDKPPLPA